MQSLALAFAASMAVDAATAAAMESWRSSGLATALAASAAATEICSERSSISAHMCLIAWKLPIGLPNCSRTFAYSVAVCSVQRASPAASAASTVAARSSTRWAETSSTSARAESSTNPRQRTGEVRGLQRFDRHAVGRRVHEQPLVAGGQQQHPVRIGAQHVLGGARHSPAVKEQVGRQCDTGGALARRQRLEQVGVRSRDDERGQRRRGDRTGNQRGGGLVDHRAQIIHRATGAAVLLGDRDAEYAQLGQSLRTGRATRRAGPAPRPALQRWHRNSRPSYGSVRVRQTARKNWSPEKKPPP